MCKGKGEHQGSRLQPVLESRNRMVLPLCYFDHQPSKTHSQQERQIGGFILKIPKIKLVSSAQLKKHYAPQ